MQKEHKNISEFPISLSKGQEKGVFSDAIRVLHDVGSEWLLDFLDISSDPKKVKVVARIRVHETFLPVLRDKLNEVMGVGKNKLFKIGDEVFLVPVQSKGIN